MNNRTIMLISLFHLGLINSAQAAYSAPNLSAPLELSLKEASLADYANVCFITDTGECRGYEFSGANSPDDTSPGGGTPDDWELDNDNRCVLEGYTLHATLLPQLTSSIQFVPL